MTQRVLLRVCLTLSAGSLVVACSGQAAEPAESGASAAVNSPMPSVSEPPAPAPTGQAAPSLIGMRWPEAVSRGAAAGLTVVPNFVGPPGPLTAECLVVQQSPLPAEPLMAPVINALLQCPESPPPSPPN